MFHAPLFGPSLLGLTSPLMCFLEESDRATGNAPKKHRALVDAPPVKNKDLVAHHGSNMFVGENENHISLSFDTPGVKLQDVKVLVEGSVLSVAAERKAGGKTVTKWEQHFNLDESSVDPTKVSATLTNGVLMVKVPKKEEAAPEDVPITKSEPPLEMDKKGLWLTIDTPGIHQSDLKIEFHKGILSVFGERFKTNDNGKRHLVSTVSRRLRIKEKLVDTSHIQAFLCDGVLTIVAPAKPAAPAKQIDIPSSTLQIDDGKSNTDEHSEANEPEEVVVETVAKDDEQ